MSDEKQMNIRSWLDQLFVEGNAIGFRGMEAYYRCSKQRTLQLFEGQLDQYTVAVEMGVAFSGLLNGSLGKAYTTGFDEESIQILLWQAKEYAVNAGIHGTIDDFFVTEQPKPICIEADMNLPYDAIQLQEKLKELSRMTLAYNPMIRKVSPCHLTEIKDAIYMKNSCGLSREENTEIRWIELGAVASDNPNGDRVNSSSHIHLDSLEDDRLRLFVDCVCEDAIRLLGSKTINTQQIPIILRGNAFADLLSGFSEALCGDKVNNQLSCLKDFEGKRVASSLFTLREDPHLISGRHVRHFDDEGNTTASKTLVNQGVLQGFLYNMDSGKKANKCSSGNGFKRDFKSPMTVGFTHLIVEKGQQTFVELFSGLNEAICITALHGLHAGINPVSGAFSLSCEGYLVKEGNPTQGLTGITVSGDIIEMLSDIEKISNDTWVSLPYMPYVESPSVRIKKLKITGKS